MKRQPGKPKLPRGEMPPGTRVHKDRKKEEDRTQSRKRRWAGACDPPDVCDTCPENGVCLHHGDSPYIF